MRSALHLVEDRGPTVVAAVLVAVLLGGCRDAVPDGHVLVVHRDAEVALPADWVPVADSLWAEIDPGAVEYVPADAPSDVPVAAVLWRDDEGAPPGLIRLPVDLLARYVELQGAPEFARLRDGPVTVTGADEAHLVQYRFRSDVLGVDIVTTYVAARVGHDEVLLLRLSGPERHVPDEVVATALATLRVTADQ